MEGLVVRCQADTCVCATAIVFPLATGFMEGLNLSGDLKDPGAVALVT